MNTLRSLAGPTEPYNFCKAQIDWVTATHRATERPKLAFAAGRSMVENEAQKGNDIQPINWRGYRGFKCGQASVGIRQDGVFLQARSDGASEYFSLIKEHATNFSRIDCAVTGLVDHQQPEVFRRSFNVLRRSTGVGHRKAQITIIANDDYGDSLLFGRRQSDRYGRFYDKGMEQRIAEAGWLFRWELELKNERARHFGFSSNDARQLQVDSHRMVSEYFATYGMRCPGVLVEPSGDNLRFAHAAKPSGDNRRVAWLLNSCRPVLSRLDARGRLPEACKALGLSVRDGVIVFTDDEKF